MCFKSAIEHVLKEEGGYSNRAEDRGGERNKGISKAIFDFYS